MRATSFIWVIAAILANLPFAARASEAVPKFDIVRNCKAEVAATSGFGETLDFCVAEEQRAKDDLTQQWGNFAREDKLSCIRATSADGVPSYVELQTCLEMASDQKTSMNVKQ